MMKAYIPLFMALLFFAGCATNQAISIRKSADETATDKDSTSYELIVLDNGFESWYLAHAKPVNYHDQNYYEYWNRQYVQAWNTHNLGSHYSRLLDGIIDYDPETDYGQEINHKLFYYFMYVENVLRIPIIPNGPKIF